MTISARVRRVRVWQSNRVLAVSRALFPVPPSFRFIRIRLWLAYRALDVFAWLCPKLPDCRFDHGAYPTEAVARFAMDAGCACYPDDREQDLCAQHIVNATPLGSMELIEAYQPEHDLVKRYR